LNGLHTGSADTVRVEAGVLVTLDNCHRQCWLALAQGRNSCAQQSGFSGTGAREHVHGRYTMCSKVFTIVPRHSVIGTQHVGFKFDYSLG
jgi:hypothetical protein